MSEFYPLNTIEWKTVREKKQTWPLGSPELWFMQKALTLGVWLMFVYHLIRSRSSILVLIKQDKNIYKCKILPAPTEGILKNGVIVILMSQNWKHEFGTFVDIMVLT
jgi:hypothetical protein